MVGCYLLIYDVVSKDADCILQFIVSTFPPPPPVTCSYFGKYFTHWIVGFSQRSCFRVQPESDKCMKIIISEK